jgi:hypothetical protein
MELVHNKKRLEIAKKRVSLQAWGVAAHHRSPVSFVLQRLRRRSISSWRL